MLLDYLRRISDHRRAQGQRYKLADVLFISILSILSGADSYRDIARFAKGHLKKLNEIFGFSWKRAPSKSRIREIFCEIDRTELEKIFRAYAKDLSDKKISLIKKNGFAIDGKSLRGSFDHLKENDMIHLLSVFCTNNQLIFAHVEIPEKTNEIPTAQILIKEMGLPEGSVYTLDAMHCQKKRLKQLRRQKVS